MNKVNSAYEILGIFKQVEVKIPSEKDLHLKKREEHKIVTSDGNIIIVPEHFKREELMDQVLFTRNFYVDPNLRGKTITADEVRVICKTDHFRKKVSLIVDIIGRSEKNKQYRLKCGAPSGNFFIPGTRNKYVKLEKI
jgi:hypothetical protein